MLDYPVSASMRVPVILNTSAGVPVTGLTTASLSASIVRSDGVLTNVTVSASDWTELTGAYISGGYYNWNIPSALANLTGVFQYCVKSPTSSPYFGVIGIVDATATLVSISNASSSILTRLGTPFSGTVSADISATYSASLITGSSGGGGSGSVLVVVGSGETSYPISSTMYVTLGLFNTGTGLPVTGVTYAQATATLFNQTGSADIALSGNWVELTTGSFSGSGVYTVTLGAQYSLSASHMVLGVRVSGADPVYLPVTVAAAASGGGGGTVDLSALGTPIITIARDIIQVGSTVQDIKARVTSIQNRVRAK